MRALTAATYVRSYMRRIPGYLSHMDAEVILNLLKWQEAQDVRGSLCEIGVHHGRLFLLLALSRQLGETAVAIDLFEDDAINTGAHSGRGTALLRNSQRLGVPISSEEIIKSSSHDLTADQILSRTHGPVRFFSVDGGHLYRDVENDLRLAQECISQEGIVAVDDFFSLLWPEVSFATYDFLRNQSEIVPVFTTLSKLYLTRRQNAHSLMNGALASLPSDVHLHPQSPVSFLNGQVAFLVESNIAHYREKVRSLIPV